jgi:hypothetical protein
MSSPVRIHDIVIAALRNRSLDADDAARLKDALRVRPGQRSLETRAGIEQQHKLIRELAHTVYSGSRNHKAESVNRDLGRYQTTTWQRHRADPECPHSDPRRRLFWHILKARDRVPGVRYLNRIL